MCVWDAKSTNKAYNFAVAANFKGMKENKTYFGFDCEHKETFVNISIDANIESNKNTESLYISSCF